MEKNSKKNSEKNVFTDHGFINFDEALRPGKIINIEEIIVSPKVIETEKNLGNFVIEEKELIDYIHQNKDRLKKHCLKYEDSSIYMGYYNCHWEKEGYGILILKDGYVKNKYDKTEYFYRKARIFDKAKQFDKAIQYYQITIANGRSVPYYYAANSAYLLGFLFEQQQNYTEAIKNYNLCLSLDGYEYENSIHQKASVALNRLNE